ncbi:nitrate reductase molybdenum cofactor assembly chaperone [Nocardioides sp.]|uniref:nitrate reductase molybdenum cofactor assembly chaperone n=1 Tax=Nocardioides sp. TaxID=35761 RepID=UPI0026036F05|nr:nitrate reductase molybdenum cofactor assembly chaperone [Nocardioides sp.]MDI6911610.1 nitrate reductase molybdenum cofactor assembly chaperone [Nocardioides sp.]
MSRRSTRTALSPEQLTIAWQSASLLLGYPDQDLLDRLELVRRASHELPGTVGEPLRETVARLDGTPLTDLEEEYVDTFDSRRRHNLFLTYFAHGDTRKRGVALLRFKQTYLASGVELSDEELPDHLCVALEFAATVDQESGRQLILDHRAGLELLRLSLVDAGSRWAGAVEAVTATLPPLQGDEIEAVRRLAAEGPPEEEVGLTPYATPGFDPGPAQPAQPDQPVALPMPSFPGGR